MNIGLIIDESSAFVAFERDKLFESWGADKGQIQLAHTLADVGQSTLFGDTPFSVIQLEDKNVVKAFVDELKKADMGNFQRLATPGLIITTNVARTATRTLEKLIKDAGGVVVLAKEHKNENPAVSIVDSMSLKADVAKFLKEFAGTDYEIVLGVANTLSKLPPAKQRLVTIDDLIVRLPTPAGSVPPWEAGDAALVGNASEAVSKFRRFVETSSLLVPLALMKTKVTKIYKISAILKENPRAQKADVAQALGMPNDWGFSKAYESAKKLGFKTMSEVNQLVIATEAKVKGASSGDPHVFMESMLVNVSMLTRR